MDSFTDPYPGRLSAYFPQKPISCGYYLNVRLENRMVFVGYRVVPEDF
jgi:hypothetical protein